MVSFLYKFFLVLLYLFSLACLASTAVGVPGNWILFGIALIIALVTHFKVMTWTYLLACLGLAVLGELLESILGVAVVAKKGGSKWGMGGTFLGGLAGVLIGAPVLPPLGSVIFGFLGAFAGAVAGEYYSYRKLDSAMRVGYWAFIGRALAVVAKLGLGLGILWIIVASTWS